MTIGIITTHAEPAADKRLLQAAQEAGYEARLLDLMGLSLAVTQKDKAHIYYNDRPIERELSVIIPRFDCPHTPFGFSVMRQFVALGVPSTDKVSSLACGRDKLCSLQQLMAHNVPIPATGFAYTRDQLKHVVKAMESFPVVIKVVDGTEGNGVYLAQDSEEAQVIFDKHNICGTRVIVQEFIAESAGTDMRSFVIDGKVVTSMRRESQTGDFRANVALGAHSFPMQLTQEEEDLVLNATKAVGMNIAGVDFIRSEHGPLILEINTAPGFTGEQGIEVITNTDIARMMVDYAASLVEPQKAEKLAA